MILNREQIEATYPGPLRDTAFAYHDLRDGLDQMLVSGGFRNHGEGRAFSESEIREVVVRVEKKAGLR